MLGTSESIQVAFWVLSKIEICSFRMSAVFLLESFFAGVWSEAQLKMRKVELKTRRKLPAAEGGYPIMSVLRCHKEDIKNKTVELHAL